MSDELDKAQVNVEGGKVTLKWGNEVVNELDISKLSESPDWEKAKQLMQRGLLYDRSAQTELGELRKQVETYKGFDSALEAAKTDDAALEHFKNKLEEAIGRPLTKKEDTAINKDNPDDDFTDPAIKALKQEIANLKKQQADQAKTFEDKEIKDEWKKMNAEADDLEKKYPGDEEKDIPKFERNEIFQFMKETGITDLDLAFRMKYAENLTEAAKKQAIDDYKEHIKDRGALFTEKGDGVTELDTDEKPPKFKSHHQRGEYLAKIAKEKGLSVTK